MADEKILKSEELTDEQLDTVAGGTNREIDKDADLMNVIGLGIQKDGPFFYESIQRQWAFMGVSVIIHQDDNTANEYYNDKGKQISREQALKIALKHQKKKVDLKNFL